MNKQIPNLLLMLIALMGCEHHDFGDRAVNSVPVTLEEAVANPDRPQSDRDRDIDRKPIEVLRFCDISAGMTVLDFQAGTGYYAEILSSLVTQKGHVIAHNHSRDGVLGDEVFEQRYGNNRLPNTELIFAKHNELELAPASLDRILMSMVYHDTYWYSPDVDWGPVDQAGLLTELYRGLKPGGRLCLIDHYAATGVDPKESVQITHRIDPAVVKNDFEQAGFELLRESDILRNTNDDYTLSIFDERVYGRTDRFLMLFSR